MSVRTRLERGNHRAAFDAFYRGAIQQSEQAALDATDRARLIAKSETRSAIQGARLGRLGNAIDAHSDKSRGRGVHRRGRDDFSASGTVFIRTRSDRTRGAIEAYTAGAEIAPQRGRWLWIATDEIPRLTSRASNRERMTPDRYRKTGLERTIGPLVMVRSINGNPLLVVKNVGVSEAGKRRSARSLTGRGRLRKGQRAKEFVVAFIGIPRTSRAARIDVRRVLQQVQEQIPELFHKAIRSVRR